MSRTYKTLPYKFSQYNVDEYERVPYEAYESVWKPREEGSYRYTQVFTGKIVTKYVSLKKAGVKTKKKKKVDSVYRWATTPSWWTREFMNRPMRKYLNRLARQCSKMNIGDLEVFDIPFSRKKPHVYYW